MKQLILAGFILYLYDGATHAPVNHAPFYVFPSKETCEDDVKTWARMAPEWLAVCKEAK